MLKKWTHLNTSLLMIFHNAVFICQYKSVKAIFIRVLACFLNRPHMWRADKWLQEMSQESFAVTRDNPSAC